MRSPAVLFALVLLTSTALSAQWLNHPTPGIPRTSDGKPDLTAPAPRGPDGRPDLSGLWRIDAGTGYNVNIVADLAPTEILPWAQALYRQRVASFSKDDPVAQCLPRGPRAIFNGGGIVRFVHTPALLAMLFEELNFRQVFMDGRALETDPNPSWMGYSVGRWDGDTLVVESKGSTSGAGWTTPAIPIQTPCEPPNGSDAATSGTLTCRSRSPISRRMPDRGQSHS